MNYTEFFVSKKVQASDVNGGGPRSSTQGSPVATRANCSSDVAGTTITNDDATGWGSAAINDWLCFDTAGLKEYTRITNVAGDNLTVTPAVTGSLAGKNVNVAGEWNTIDHASSVVSTSTVNASGDPPRVNIRSEATAYNESVLVDNGGALAVPITYEGYETTVGDGCPTDDLPEIDADGSGATAFDSAAQTYIILANLRAHTDAANKLGFDLGNHCYSYRLRAKSTNYRAIQTGQFNTLVAALTEDSTVGIYADWYTKLLGCVASGPSGYGYHLRPYATAVLCLADSPGDDCYYIEQDGGLLLGCIGYNSTGGSGVRCQDLVGETQPLIANCVFTENNQYGIEVDAADKYLALAYHNAYYGNGVGERLNVHREVGGLTLTGDPFRDAAGGDFRLNNRAGRGAACRAAGFPTALLDGINRGWLDLGALQARPGTVPGLFNVPWQS